MADKRWKVFERRIAELFGGKRAWQENGEDVSHDIYSIECKTREDYPKWFTDAVEQAKRHAPEGKVPLTIFHRVGDQYTEAKVVITLSDFLDWFV
jgi:hypothetical protein